MKLIVAPIFLSFITRGFARAITLWPFIILKHSDLKDDAILVRHERIHLKQQLELGIVGFYIWYSLAYCRWWMKYRNHMQAYARISFEREAFNHEHDCEYLNQRSFFAFYKYVSNDSLKQLKNKQKKMNKIEHIGIAVKSLKEANKTYASLFDSSPYKSETVEEQKVTTSFFKVGPNKIELLEATAPESPIAKFIDKRGEGIHHIAFEVNDIVSEMKRLEDEGFRLLNTEPVKGADNKLVCFVHPKSANGVLIELCQSIIK